MYVLFVIYDFQNSAKEVEKMAKFLDLSVSPEMCAAIANKCAFSNMVKDKVGLEDEFWTHAWRDSKPGYYRKGTIIMADAYISRVSNS